MLKRHWPWTNTHVGFSGVIRWKCRRLYGGEFCNSLAPPSALSPFMPAAFRGFAVKRHFQGLEIRKGSATSIQLAISSDQA